MSKDSTPPNSTGNISTQKFRTNSQIFSEVWISHDIIQIKEFSIATKISTY
jgi:hypothetical protein